MTDRKAYQKTYHEANKEKRKAYRRQYYLDNKEAEDARNKQYAILNVDKLSEYYQEYRDTHKEEISVYSKEYTKKNSSTIAVRKAKYMKERKKNDPSFKLRGIISTKIAVALKLNGSSKNGDSCWNYFGYSLDMLKEHLEKQFEPWMTWYNHGKYNQKVWDDNDSATWTWQIDHIIPQSDLPYTSMIDDNFRKCWALANLRPLSAKQNVIDGTTRIRHGNNNV